MAKGPKVSDEIQKTIAKVYDSNRNLRAKEVLGEVKRHHGDQVPSLSYVQKLLSDIRKRAKKEATKGLEVAWTLSSSEKHGIPHDADEALLRVWRWNVVVGRTFTVREACWVARIRRFAPYEKLLSHAAEYALRERVAASLGHATADTLDLDAQLAFGRNAIDGWPYRTAVHMRIVPANQSVKLASSKLKDEGRRLMLEITMLLFANGSASRLVRLVAGVNWQPENELPEHADLVYALWMRELVNQSLWNKLTQDRKNSLAKQLYEEITIKCNEATEDTESWAWQTGDKWAPLNLRVRSLRPNLAGSLKHRRGKTASLPKLKEDK